MRIRIQLITLMRIRMQISGSYLSIWCGFVRIRIQKTLLEHLIEKKHWRRVFFIFWNTNREKTFVKSVLIAQLHLFDEDGRRAGHRCGQGGRGRARTSRDPEGRFWCAALRCAPFLNYICGIALHTIFFKSHTALRCEPSFFNYTRHCAARLLF